MVIDLAEVRKGSGKDATSKIDFLVHMAKAEAPFSWESRKQLCGGATPVAGTRYCDLRRAQCTRENAEVSISIK